ncbi:hypothetical protein TVAG_302200 [Trichomonas vaginalis G3]|uniref:Uncharacterized protein n=1 Tax=Trichomonas vaginalis (strain ATCC PRA-98 / G3) TaxID=412133 RepID=A2EGP5_TRIV3|nr:armadillo (ARM) repeat-containing protein family [Trichomonas vaginalis G3]EAY08133.1 hypothetical protein TVAG_302200 [Trichomonas vaginalis G3]KAI5548736.1 armadillo (ARM) repeat-containing protein family [Trichomonas vaginalis G3]|eukprot:XP_001320356.1 hypothetical protein [Trichomonas vaginalis G3]
MNFQERNQLFLIVQNFFSTNAFTKAPNITEYIQYIDELIKDANQENLYVLDFILNFFGLKDSAEVPDEIYMLIHDITIILEQKQNHITTFSKLISILSRIIDYCSLDPEKLSEIIDFNDLLSKILNFDKQNYSELSISLVKSILNINFQINEELSQFLLILLENFLFSENPDFVISSFEVISMLIDHGFDLDYEYIFHQVLSKLDCPNSAIKISALQVIDNLRENIDLDSNFLISKLLNQYDSIDNKCRVEYLRFIHNCIVYDESTRLFLINSGFVEFLFNNFGNSSINVKEMLLTVLYDLVPVLNYKKIEVLLNFNFLVEILDFIISTSPKFSICMLISSIYGILLPLGKVDFLINFINSYDNSQMIEIMSEEDDYKKFTDILFSLL